MNINWTFPAYCIKVIDGDTIDVFLDIGFKCTRTERLRLMGVNCPELHGPTSAAGMRAKKFTEGVIAGWQPIDERWPLAVQTFKADVFGRYLAHVWPMAADEGSPHLSALLLGSGNAVVFHG